MRLRLRRPTSEMKPMFARRAFPFAAIVYALLALPLGAEDRPQWGERYTRNMVSPERGLPVSFDQ